MTLLLSAASAVFYAIAVVAQQRAARAVDHAASLRPRLLVELASRPTWLAGIGANGLALGLRSLALRHGSLILVQTVAMSGVVLALPIASVVDRESRPRREWLGVLAAVGGVVVFLAVAQPTRGSSAATGGRWAIASALALAGGLVLVRFARGAPPARRAALLAGAGGGCLALAAALLKASAGELDSGVVSTVFSWPPYALLGAGAAGVLLVQSAFQAGPLAAAVPVVSVVEPLASVALGLWLFHERVTGTAAAHGVELFAVVAMMAGVLAVTRHPR